MVNNLFLTNQYVHVSLQLVVQNSRHKHSWLLLGLFFLNIVFTVCVNNSIMFYCLNNRIHNFNKSDTIFFNEKLLVG